MSSDSSPERQEIYRLQQEVLKLKSRIIELEFHIESQIAFKTSVKDLLKRTENAENELKGILSSPSWRITSPFRRLKSGLSKINNLRN